MYATKPAQCFLTVSQYAVATISGYVSDIPAPFTVVSGIDEKRFFVVNDLLPNNGYTFRVLAKNERGVGTPSSPRGNTINSKNPCGKALSQQCLLWKVCTK